MGLFKMRSILLLFFGCALGCHSPKPFYSEIEYGWKDHAVPPKNHLARIVYLLGDAGETPEKSAPVINTIKHHIVLDTAKNDIVFLGDNIYPKGLPDKSSKTRIQAETRIYPQLELAKYITGKAIFLPGNHDWAGGNKSGCEMVAMEEVFIEEFLNKGNTFLPDNGCPGPAVMGLTDNLVIVAIDVQWWINQGRESNNLKCNPNSLPDFIQKIKSIVRKHRGKTILIVAHHPLESNGNHGGYFSVKPHLFPLTHIQPSLFIPLPILGTLYVMGRKYLGHAQDLSHANYKDFIKEIKNGLTGAQKIIYAAGHEHNLQYFNNGDFHTIISGSASKTTWAARGKGALFTYSTKGFAKLILTHEGESWVEFWKPSTSSKNGELVFKKKLFGLE